MTASGAPALVLGFLVRGQWRGLQLDLPVASDVALTLAQWLTDYVQAHDQNGTDAQ